MALETLIDVLKIGGFDVVDMDKLRIDFPEKFNESGGMDWLWFEKEIRPKNFIYVRHDVNSISFTIQDGPIGDKGVNGCQVDTMLESVLLIIKGLNTKFPCRENSLAITNIEVALMWLDKRKKDRENRGVEGTSKS